MTRKESVDFLGVSPKAKEVIWKPNPYGPTTEAAPDDHGTPRDENRVRGNWSNKLEFILSCFSYAVGLGTIWRFPYLCYRNGGGAFLVPYMIMYVFAGLPLFFFELSLGQYASEGPISVWKVAPLFQGIGYAMFLISFFIGIYYNMIVAWSFYYLFASFTSVLPWKSCGQDWNTEACRDVDTKSCISLGGLVNKTGACIFQANVSETEWSALETLSKNAKSPADEYFHHKVLGISDGIHEIGNVRWELALCLLLAWVCVYFALFKGVKSVGKVVYFTALFPYVILLILLVRAATLPGYVDGILFYITPQWEKLTEARVWGDAAMQIFFSLSPCWGGLITLASYNRFHNNCFRDAIIVATGNILTAVFAGFVIFGVIGFMAHELGKPIDQVATQGAGLAFIAYPEAVSRLPIAPLWSILFFIMLLTLGLGTQFTVLETVVTTIVDLWPDKLRGKNHKWVLLGAAFFMYIMGLIMCTNGGMFVLQLIDNYAATYSALIIGMAEVGVIAWYYGVDRFLNDIRLMIGYYPPPRSYWRFIWKYFTPLIIIGILIFSWIDLKPLTYGAYEYPWAANAGGWVLTAASVLMIPLVAGCKIAKQSGPFWHRVRTLMEPTSDWGPALQNHRMEAHVPVHNDSQIPLAPQCPYFDDNLDFELAPVSEQQEYSLHSSDSSENGLEMK